MSTPAQAIGNESTEAVISAVADLMSAGPVCARCLAFRLGRPRTGVYAILQRINAVVTLSTEVDRCSRCPREAVVHTLA